MKANLTEKEKANAVYLICDDASPNAEEKEKWIGGNMGTAFYCYIVKINDDIPDYSDPTADEIDQFLSEYRDISLDNIHDMSDEDYTEEAKTLEIAIQEVKNAIESNSRECTIEIIAGNKYIVTGGMSWGDEPTNLFEALHKLDCAGILPRLGLTVSY